MTLPTKASESDEGKTQRELAEAVRQFISRAHDSRTYTNGEKKPEDSALTEKKARVFANITRVLEEPDR